MHLRATAALAALASLAAPITWAAGAWAAGPGGEARAPSASVTTYLPAGTPLPMSPVTARWSHVDPGCAGKLEASGPVLTGTTTVVRGDFLSRPFRPRHGHLVSLGLERDGKRVAQPLPEGAGMAFRVREIGQGWSPWLSLNLRIEPTLPSPYSVSVGVGVSVSEVTLGHRPPLEQVQVRLSDRVSSTGLVDDAFQVRVGC